ncbi:MAG: hypothetical protein ACO1SX_17205 [Actinomycetota bacterium]
MRALEFVTEVDRNGRVQVSLPSDAPRGTVRVLVLFPGDDKESPDRVADAALERASDLADEQEDLYALADGEGEPR